MEDPWGVGTTDAPLPKVTAVLVARDEEAILPRCLAALTGFVDEPAVGDTGSVDITISVARATGAIVVETAWALDLAAVPSAYEALVAATQQ